MDTSDLCQRILARCQKHRWYGPDADHPSSFGGGSRISYDLHSGERIVRDRWQDRRFREFAFPPATTEQIRVTEQALGFTLPTALRRIYTELANGGFGPAYGLTGAIGGFPSVDVPQPPGELVLLYRSDDVGGLSSTPGSSTLGGMADEWPGIEMSEEESLHSQDPTLAATLSKGTWRIPGAAAGALRAHPDCYLECESTPDGLLTLCHWGCAIFSHLDRWTGHVYIGAAWTRHGVDRVDNSEGDDIVLGLEYQAASVEEWLDRWLRDDLSQSHASIPILLDDLTHLEQMLPRRREDALTRAERWRNTYGNAQTDEGEVRCTGSWLVPRGAQMPSIALPSTAGRTVDLAAEAQTHHLVVFFYPGDEDASRYHVLDFYSKGPYAFRDSLDAFHSLGAEVFGVSLQRTERQRQFAEREQLSFELLSDSSERFTHEVGIPIWVSETGERFAASGVLIIRRGGEIADVLSHFVVQGQLEKVPLEKVVEAVRRLE